MSVCWKMLSCGSGQDSRIMDRKCVPLSDSSCFGTPYELIACSRAFVAFSAVALSNSWQATMKRDASSSMATTCFLSISQ